MKDYVKLKKELVNGRYRNIYTKKNGKRQYVLSNGNYVPLSTFNKTLKTSRITHYTFRGGNPYVSSDLQIADQDGKILNCPLSKEPIEPENLYILDGTPYDIVSLYDAVQPSYATTGIVDTFQTKIQEDIIRYFDIGITRWKNKDKFWHMTYYIFQNNIINAINIKNIIRDIIMNKINESKNALLKFIKTILEADKKKQMIKYTNTIDVFCNYLKHLILKNMHNIIDKIINQNINKNINKNADLITLLSTLKKNITIENPFNKLNGHTLYQKLLDHQKQFPPDTIDINNILNVLINTKLNIIMSKDNHNIDIVNDDEIDKVIANINYQLFKMQNNIKSGNYTITNKSITLNELTYDGDNKYNIINAIICYYIYTVYMKNALENEHSTIKIDYIKLLSSLYKHLLDITETHINPTVV
jgi:hypothetical protein